jgi:putative hemolysin
MDVLLIVVLIAANGVLAMSEMALSAARKTRLIALSESGDAGATQAMKLMDEPTRFLSTVQIGITSIGALIAIIGDAAFSASLSHLLQSWGLQVKPADYTAVAIVVAIITFTSILFGELVPKRIGQMYPEAVARVMSRPMALLAKVTKPAVALLSGCTQAVLKLLRMDPNAAREVTEDEIHASLDEGVDAGVIEQQEHQMVRNVFHLDDRPLTSLMVHRADVVWFDEKTPVAQAAHRAGAEGHSWYPVCRGGLDDVIGIVSVHQLLSASAREDDDAQLGKLSQAATFVPESLTGMELLEQFRANAARMLFVVDEYGVVQGLLTPKDLLEAITGELKPTAPADAWAIEQADGLWTIDGTMPIAEFKSRLRVDDALPDEDKARYNTVAGLVMSVAGRMLNQGDVVDVPGLQFTVHTMAGRRVAQLQVKRTTTSED